jgi:hypothetical protein
MKDDDLDAPGGSELIDGLDYLALQVRRVADAGQAIANAIKELAAAVANR